MVIALAAVELGLSVGEMELPMLLAVLSTTVPSALELVTLAAGPMLLVAVELAPELRNADISE